MTEEERNLIKEAIRFKMSDLVADMAWSDERRKDLIQNELIKYRKLLCKI